MRVSLAYGDPAHQSMIELDLPAASTLGDALSAVALPDEIREHMNSNAVGVWGKARARDYKLREGDRIEIYRPLVADPKTARRKRAAKR